MQTTYVHRIYIGHGTYAYANFQKIKRFGQTIGLGRIVGTLKMTRDPTSLSKLRKLKKKLKKSNQTKISH